MKLSPTWQALLATLCMAPACAWLALEYQRQDIRHETLLLRHALKAEQQWQSAHYARTGRFDPRSGSGQAPDLAFSTRTLKGGLILAQAAGGRQLIVLMPQTAPGAAEAADQAAPAAPGSALLEPPRPADAPDVAPAPTWRCLAAPDFARPPDCESLADLASLAGPHGWGQ